MTERLFGVPPPHHYFHQPTKSDQSRRKATMTERFLVLLSYNYSKTHNGQSGGEFFRCGGARF
jgi:hypothetical protein